MGRKIFLCGAGLPDEGKLIDEKDIMKELTQLTPKRFWL